MMATYFHGGSEIQPGDNLQTLYLMNPNYVAAYTSEAHNNNPSAGSASQPPPNMLLLNPSAGLGPSGLPSPPPPHQQQQFIGIPLAGPHSENPGRPSPHHHHQISPGSNLHGVAVSRVHYNLWSSAADPSPTHPGPIPTALVATSSGAQGGLSLSLSPQQQNNNNSNSNNNNPVAIVGDEGRMSVTVVGGSSSISNGGGGVQGVILGSKYLKAAQELLDEVVNVESYCSSNNNNNKGGMMSNNNGESGESSGAHKDKAAKDKEPEGSGVADGSKKAASAEQLSTAQRQELQMKKAKLLNMLDEVEQRYRQYHSQMQLVVSSFEQAAGVGSAKSYTSLALQTISRQFRCLKDAIVSQIKATSKSLGEEDASGGGSKLDGVGSRLRFVDHQLRQQRALQQLGMMQHNAWRPQRGLPERAVSVLRAWLFEHFLHPYPKDSDKHMLAKQTGLTRSQVSNWFINARVRLWKPMVEEMYVEEMKSQEQNGGNSENNNNNNQNNANNNSANTTGNEPTSKAIGAPQQQQQNEQHHDSGNGGGLIQAHHQQAGDRHQTTNDMISNMSAMSTTTMSSQGFTLIGSSSDMESLMARSPKKQRSMQSSPSSILSMDMEMKPPDHHHHHHQRQSPMMIAANQHHHHQASGGGAGAPGFNPYMVNDMGRFNPDQLITTHHHHHHQYQGGANNNGSVSLTLGLPHCENQTLSLSGNHQQTFIPNQGMQLGRRLDIGNGEDQGTDFCGISMGMGQPSHPNNGYETIDIQSRKRFAAHQLLHDFVA